MPTPSKTASSAPAPPADKLFPLAIARRGGFAGVDDRATIAADGSAVVTRQGRAPVRTSVPAGTMAELRRLLKSPELTGRTTPDATTVCNDGYEYEFASPSSTTTVLECDDTHGAALDRMLAVAAELFNN